jgi:amino acid adenylation domain-containing protein/non-ribosomal peptide synthase protein (TIGR01720 family)
MLFHEVSEPRARTYFRQAAFSIEGDFDPQCCSAAWNALMRRHELLRSVFDYESTSHFLQLVLKERTLDFASEDLRGLDPAARESRIERYCTEDRARGFDLRRDCLMRIQVFRRAQHSFEMIWSHPHILLDGWSGSVLMAEFAHIYTALRKGRTWDLPPPPSYQGYVDAVAATSADEALTYWRGQLRGYERLASLPKAAGARRAPTPRPQEHVLSPGSERSILLERLAAGCGATVNTVMRAVWGVVLSRYNDCDDVVFGSVVSGRHVDAPGVERLVGMVINTVPVRVRTVAGEGFVSLVRRLQYDMVQAIPHDHVALAAVQGSSALPAGLLDHLLVFENYPAADALHNGSSSGLGFHVTSVRTREQANYAFGIVVHPGECLSMSFPYDANVHTRGQMVQLEQQLLAVIDQVIADRDIPVECLEILPAVERDELEHRATGPELPRATGQSLIDLWQAQVDAAPGRIALEFAGEQLTYSQLDEWANTVASDLECRYSPRLEEPIGVLATRGMGRVAALLGILKLGAVYLPLSPGLPAERIHHMLHDAGCRVVLTDGAGQAAIEAVRPGLALVIPRRVAAPEWSADRSHRSSQAAYIIYTSGSTGRPKGVVVEHGGFVNMILEQINGFGVTERDRVLQFASCSFDASLSEIFMALLTGATLVLIDEETMRDGDGLRAYLSERKISVVTLPPSYLRTLERATLPSLRVLITAGEPAHRADALHYATRLRYFNAYGPTEVSVCASFHEVRADAEYPFGIPIGRPLANTTMRILDRAGRLMPRGAVGEICIGGRGLARGYQNSPELTAEKFVRSPFAGEDRLYRTGDTGLMLEDGNILYLGRRDAQVKLNGFRIELGEIESVLRAFPGVRDAAATVHVVAAEQRQLAAYVVGEAVDLAALQRHLGAVLPSQMAPRTLSRLAHLPRTIAGKIDRRALPVPDLAAPYLNRAPASAAERVVAAALQDVLGCPNVGAYDSFRALGGDSLTAIKVVNRLRRLGLSIAIQQVLRLDRVAAIAEFVRDAARESEPVRGTLPLTPIQRAFFSDRSAPLGHFNHAVLLASAEPLQESAVQAAIDILWRHHDALRQRFPDAGRRAEGEIMDPDLPPRTRFVDLCGTANAWNVVRTDVERLHRSIDIESGPLLHVVCYRLAEGDHLLFVAHHLVTDAVSWRFLVEDLITAYGQSQCGAPVQLPAKTTSYQAWARALVAYGTSEALQREAPFWQEVERSRVHPLPVDGTRIPHHYGQTATISLRRPAFGGIADSTMQAVLLAALARARAAWDGRDATRVMLTSHGRIAPMPDIDVTRTVGWFSAEFPFVLINPGRRDILYDAEAIEHELAKIPGRGIGYGVLRWLTSGGLATHAQPDVSVNYVGRSEQRSWAGFAISERLSGYSVGALPRTSLLELEAMLDGGSLKVSICYCPAIHHPETVAALGALLGTELQAAFADLTARDRKPNDDCILTHFASK